MPLNRRPVLLFAEDEAYLRQAFLKLLQQRGYEVLCAAGPDEALRLVEKADHLDLALTDVVMALEPNTIFSEMETKGGAEAGIALANELRRKFPRLPLVFWTFSYNPNLREQVRTLGNARLISKRQDATEVFDVIAEKLEGIKQGTRPRIFLVHGHDDRLLGEVRELIRGKLALPDPVVLRDRASFTKTLIEKIEYEAMNIDLVVVMLTPDDKVISETDGKILHRARQNVIFELGYFMGLLGRSRGNIVVLHKGHVELPSNVHGLLAIDVSNGLESAETELRRELEEWTDSATNPD